jgi:hypothetical protein
MVHSRGPLLRGSCLQQADCNRMARDALPEWQCTIAGRHYSKMIHASYAVYNFQREHGVVREQEQDIANIPI